jgi:glutathione S-transferase
LAQLSNRLGDSDWLDGEFSAGDLLMIEVLRRLGSSTLLDEFPNLAAYVARGEARRRLQTRVRRAIRVFQAASNGERRLLCRDLVRF